MNFCLYHCSHNLVLCLICCRSEVGPPPAKVAKMATPVCVIVPIEFHCVVCTIPAEHVVQPYMYKCKNHTSLSFPTCDRLELLTSL